MNNLKNIIKQAIETINKEGVILYPTDTIWGLGCDATNSKAINKIYSIKNRETTKPLILLMHSTEMLSRYIKKIPLSAYEIIDKSTCPTTIIYENPINLPPELTQINSIGIRIVKNNYLVNLLDTLNKPLTSTSANISGTQSPLTFNNIDNSIKEIVNYIIPEYIMPHTTQAPSKIIKIKNDLTIELLRQ